MNFTFHIYILYVLNKIVLELFCFIISNVKLNVLQIEGTIYYCLRILIDIILIYIYTLIYNLDFTIFSY